eukprot:s2997_g4.t1
MERVNKVAAETARREVAEASKVMHTEPVDDLSTAMPRTAMPRTAMPRTAMPSTAMSTREETAEERADALRRGKATSSVIGIKAMGKRFNVLMTIQVPVKQRASSAAKYMMDLGSKSTVTYGAGGEIIEIEAGAEGGPVEAAPPGSREPKRHDSEHVTITVVVYNVVKGGVPSTEDVINAIDDLEKLYSACSGNARLADSSFDFMKQELQVKDTWHLRKLFPGSWSGVHEISTRRARRERRRPIEAVLALRARDLSLGVAVGSSTQIALLVVPFSVIVGWCYDVPMTLDFRPFDTSVLLLSVLMISLVLRDGASNWLEGAILIAIYVLVGIMCWFIPKHEHGEA